MNEITIPASIIAATIGTLGQVKSARGMTVNDIQSLQAQLQAYLNPPMQPAPLEGEPESEPTEEEESAKRIADATARLEAAAAEGNG